MLLRLYRLAWLLARPFLWLKLRRRGRAEPLYLHAQHQRMACYTAQERAQAQQAAGQWLWVHAVSLGEMRAAGVLVAALRARQPGLRLLLTQSTATGWAQGQQLLQDGDMQVWLPWDDAGAVRRFVALFRPRLGLLMETEIWPQLLQACQQAGVPLALVNARVNGRTLRRWMRLPALAHQIFGCLALACAQTQQDARHLQQLGVASVCITGNLKFDMQPDAHLLAQGQRWRARMEAVPVLMLASSREGEEQMWLLAWQQMRAALPDGVGVQWLIVPRHPQRFEEVAALLQAAGLAVSRRSQWPADGPPPGSAGPDGATVWLGDSVGEMPLYYSISSVAIMGGSFAPLGGQNLIEACACGCPVLLGPHTFNFAQASEQALLEGAAQRCHHMQHAVQQALHLVAAPAPEEQPDHMAATMAQAARNFARHHQGAAQRVCDALVQAGLL